MRSSIILHALASAFGMSSRRVALRARISSRRRPPKRPRRMERRWTARCIPRRAW